ncbi:HEPN domain-containing protein [Metallosphaera hakonensis]|nr:HEPN domain-containing protein [Metallosphaera hakonensis]
MEEYKKWINQAKEDLKTAEILHENGRYYASVFFCHQSVEKGLKALLIKGRKDPGKTHSLSDLLEIIETDLGVQIPNNVKKAVNQIIPHYTLSTYPDVSDSLPAQIYDAETSERILRSCKEVLEWLDQNLQWKVRRGWRIWFRK